MTYKPAEGAEGFVFDEPKNIRISDVIEILTAAQNKYGDILCEVKGIYSQKQYVINEDTKTLESVPTLIIS